MSIETETTNIPSPPAIENSPDPFVEPLSLLSSDLKEVATRIQELEQAHLQRIEAAGAQFKEQLHRQFEAEMRKKLEQEFRTAVEVIREEFQQRIEASSSEWQTERRALLGEIEQLRQQVGGHAGMTEEVKKTEDEIAALDQEIQAMLDDSSVALSKVMQKRTQHTALEAYLKGLKFRTGQES